FHQPGREPSRRVPPSREWCDRRNQFRRRVRAFDHSSRSYSSKRRHRPALSSYNKHPPTNEWSPNHGDTAQARSECAAVQGRRSRGRRTDVIQCAAELHTRQTKMKQTRLLLTLTLVLCASASAQTRIPKADTQSWNDVQVTIPLNKKFEFVLL